MKSMIDNELVILHQSLLQMGALCEKALSNVIKLVLDCELSCAETALEIEFEIRNKERGIEDLCLKILMRHQPVAQDLRKISSALKMITDMNRIGRQARDIADIFTMTDMNLCQGNPHLRAMVEAVSKMLTDSFDAYVNSDLKACQAVKEYDNIVDEFFNRIKEHIVTSVTNDRAQIENGMYLLMMAKYFEKIGDHAANIARWVMFSITGRHSLNLKVTAERRA